MARGVEAQPRESGIPNVKRNDSKKRGIGPVKYCENLKYDEVF